MGGLVEDLYSEDGLVVGLSDPLEVRLVGHLGHRVVGLYSLDGQVVDLYSMGVLVEVLYSMDALVVGLFALLEVHLAPLVLASHLSMPYFGSC